VSICGACSEWEAKYNALLEEAQEFAWDAAMSRAIRAGSWSSALRRHLGEREAECFTEHEAVEFLANHGQVEILARNGRYVAFRCEPREVQGE
jgi:hypothetical protein